MITGVVLSRSGALDTEGSAILIPVARQHPTLISSTKVSPERSTKKEEAEGKNNNKEPVKGAMSSSEARIGGQGCRGAKKS